MSNQPHYPVHSTGRGGAGNIGEDPVEYTDGSVRREGREGVSEGGPVKEFSTGRGGAGNIVHGQVPPEEANARTDKDVVPEVNQKPPYSDFHTGRGGQGNVHRDKYDGHSTKHDQEHANESLKTKLKHAIGMDKK